MTARGPFWMVPTEVVRACACPQGMADIIRAAVQDVSFAPHAIVQLVDGRFIATLSYQPADAPGRSKALSVQLMAVVDENSLGAAG